MFIKEQSLTRIQGQCGKTSPVNAKLEPAANYGCRVEAAAPASGRFGVAFLVPYYQGRLNRVQLHISPGNAATFRIEASGFVTRMQKTFVEFDSTGKLLRRGEEIAAQRIACEPNGDLIIEIDFTAHRSRLEWFYVFAMPAQPPAIADQAGYFSWTDFEFQCLEPSDNQGVHIEDAAADEIFFSIDELLIFRNYFHLEFELYKAGAKLTGLSLESPVKFENAQWWTHQHIGKANNKAQIGHGQMLTPRHPPLALPSPHLMEQVGPQFAWLGHCITAVFGEYQDARLWSGQESDNSISGIVLHATFDDGTQVELPLQSGGKAKTTPACDPEWLLIRKHRTTICEDRMPVFLEVGARGPSSEIARALAVADYEYLGVDISAGANVDIVGDAHLLSKFVEAGSVDVVYSNCVMEHLLNPAKFTLEASAVLRLGGIFVATVPVTWPLHAEPWDYWRMSSHAWPSLLNHMTGFEIISVREHGQASIVPSLAKGMEMVRMQYDPAPLFTSVVARKIGGITSGWHAWSPELASGSYDP